MPAVSKKKRGTLQWIQAQLSCSKQPLRWAQHSLIFILFWGTIQELWPMFFRLWYILHVLRGNPFICALSLSPRARISLIVKQDKAAILTLKTLGRNVFTISSLSSAYYASLLWWTQFLSPSSFLHSCLNSWEISSWRTEPLYSTEKYIPTSLLLDVEGRRRSMSCWVCLFSPEVKLMPHWGG